MLLAGDPGRALEDDTMAALSPLMALLTLHHRPGVRLPLPKYFSSLIYTCAHSNSVQPGCMLLCTTLACCSLYSMSALYEAVIWCAFNDPAVS